MARTTYVRFPNGETYKNERALWADAVASGRAELLTATDGEKARKDWLRSKLLAVIPVKSTIKIICTHTASSGMSARFVVLIPVVTDKGLEIVDRTRDVAELCGMRQFKDGEIVMTGCGYNKAFEIVYSLGNALWPNGTPEPHGTRNGTPDSSGGYALNHN